MLVTGYREFRVQESPRQKFSEGEIREFGVEKKYRHKRMLLLELEADWIYIARIFGLLVFQVGVVFHAHNIPSMISFKTTSA